MPPMSGSPSTHDRLTAPRGAARAGATNMQHLLAYVADLELEVDRLRRHHRLVHQEVRGALDHIRDLCTYSAPPDGALTPLAEVARAAARLSEAVRELQDPPGYHPSHDQVIAVAVRPLAEHVFRWQ